MADVFPLLVPLIDEARRQKKWLWCSYQDMWFTPDELEDHNRQGRFRWDPGNFRLRDPMEKLAALDREIASLSAERNKMLLRIREWSK